MKLMYTDKEQDGFENEWYWDDATKKMHLKRYQIIDDNLDANKAELNSYSDYRPFSDVQGTFKAASIPNGLIEKWMKEGFNIYTCDNKELKKRLNSAEYSKLRTSPGKF